MRKNLPPPLRSPTTSMHWRSIHGKRLLGDKPLGLPAQKGWELPRLLIGLPPPPTLWKFAADSVFIDAFENCLLNLSILYHREAQLSIRWVHKKPARNPHYFLQHAQTSLPQRQVESFLLWNVRHSCNHIISSEKYNFVFLPSVFLIGIRKYFRFFCIHSVYSFFIYKY